MVRLVKPLDAVIVEEAGKLGLAGMMEIYPSNSNDSSGGAGFRAWAGRVIYDLGREYVGGRWSWGEGKVGRNRSG
jgi:hypothetical protein